MSVVLRRAARAACAFVAVALVPLPVRAEPSAAPAFVDETQSCIDASDRGQTLRIDRHLRDARVQFAACARRVCPAEIRTRCGEWLDATERAIPQIVFSVKDEDGGDIGSVRVRVDGAVARERYDGAALALDPGEHAFVFEAEGKASLARTFRLAQGERDRRERIVLGGATGVEAGPASRGSGVRTAGFVLGGAGLAGIVAGSALGVAAILDNNDARCDAGNVCQDPQARRDAQGVAMGSTIGFVAGGALLVAGVILFLVAPHHAATAALPPPVPGVSTAATNASLVVATW